MTRPTAAFLAYSRTAVYRKARARAVNRLALNIVSLALLGIGIAWLAHLWTVR